MDEEPEELEELDFNELLDTGYTVSVKINTDHNCLIIPSHLRKRQSIVLGIGHNTEIKIPDLILTDDGISCTLHFDGKPFLCFIPWESVIGYGGEAVNYIKSLKLDITKPKTIGTPKDSNGKVIRPPWLRVIK